MHPDVQTVQAKLKEILYDCVVDVKATKAALFLYDQPSNRYELVTEYGFKGAIRSTADDKDPIVDRCSRTKTVFYVNSLMEDPRLSAILYESKTERLLVAPIYQRGKLVGFVDMRDKAAKAPFDANDAPIAQRVADRIVELFADKNVFGHRFITLSGKEPLPAVLTGVYGRAAEATPAPFPKPAAVSAPIPTPAPQPAITISDQATSFVPRISNVILEARTGAERVRNAPAAIDTLSEAEMNVIREVLRGVLLIPGAVIAAFSAFGHLGGVQEIAARALPTDEALNLLQSKLNSWLAKRGESGGPLRNRVQMPAGTSGSAIRDEDIKKVFTAPIAAGPVKSLYLSVGFAVDPERSMHELLAAFHQQLQLAIEQSMSRRQANASRIRIAEKVVEPDFCRFPELRRHSNAVVARADAFAKFLGLTPMEIETARVVALVHDAGMRLLDYDRLYRKRDLSPDDLSILREHTIVGAAIVDPLLGPEIARAVLCHRERFDGEGYPSKIRGEEIPLLSRIVQLCDVYEAMTSKDNYQPPQAHDAAMNVIAAGSGLQFDPQLARRFEEMLRSV